MKIKTNQQFKTRFIPTQSYESEVKFNLDDKLTFVQANMGLGKTE